MTKAYPHLLPPDYAHLHAPAYAHLHPSGVGGAAGNGTSFGMAGPKGAVRPVPSLLDRPLRAVHVGPCFVRGGAEQQVIDLAHFLNPNRVHLQKCIVTMASLVDPRVRDDMPAPVIVGGRNLVRQAANECDVLLFWGMGLDEWLADCRPRLCVYLAHGDGAWSRNLLAASAGVTDHVIAVSRRVQDQVCRGFPSTVIFNGVNAARLAQSRSRRDVRASLGFTEQDFVLGYVGRFAPEKRVHYLLHAVAELPRHFKALLVGWGELEVELLQLANRLIPGRFAFTTVHDHLGDFYQAIDALCLLSTQEGFALVILEAMMCERPVIATSVGSVPEIIRDRVNGLIVDDIPSVCQAAQLLQEHPHWARGVAAEAKAYAQQHGHALRMAGQYEDLLEQLWVEKYGTSQQRQEQPAL
jgi:glycosyltransferase involved in cell wall biosynthesis